MTTTVKTSIRLALTALGVCGITFAAAGAPLPFASDAHRQVGVLEAPLPLTTPDTPAIMPVLPGQFSLN